MTEASEIELVERKFEFGDVTVGRPNLRTEAAFAAYMSKAVRAQIVADAADAASRDEEMRSHRDDVTAGEYQFGRRGFVKAMANPIYVGQWLRYWLLQVGVDKLGSEWTRLYNEQKAAWAKEVQPKLAGLTEQEVLAKVAAGELLSPWDANLRAMLDDPNPLAL